MPRRVILVDVMQADHSSGADERRIQVEVCPHSFIAVVSVDEQDVDGQSTELLLDPRARLFVVRIAVDADDALFAPCEPRPEFSRLWRDLDVDRDQDSIMLGDPCKRIQRSGRRGSNLTDSLRAQLSRALKKNR